MPQVIRIEGENVEPFTAPGAVPRTSYERMKACIMKGHEVEIDSWDNAIAATETLYNETGYGFMLTRHKDGHVTIKRYDN